MVRLFIDSEVIHVEEGTTILEAARKIGIDIPTLCYFKDLNEIGACRICVVELAGTERLISSCNTLAEDGMEIYTNTEKVKRARKVNMGLILSQHNGYCPTCVRNGNCQLQTTASNLGMNGTPYNLDIPQFKWNEKVPLIRDDSKCIKCMRCIQVCDKVQDLNIWDTVYSGSRTSVGVSCNRTIEQADCAYCGQCITHCPTGALKERDDINRVIREIDLDKKIPVIQIAPSVRVAWGEHYGLERGFANDKRLVAGLRRLGFKYIFDTDFSADLTIMEEATEFLERFQSGELKDYPMFTSCCPGWVRFMKSQYPHRVKYLSTSKSPQQMFGAVAKTYYAQLLGVSPEDLFLVSIMPCIAKKHECALPTMKSSGFNTPDVDVVLTTRELVRLLRLSNINPMRLEEDEFDAPLGEASGAGHIFGATGGVMEAALRSAYYFVTGENPPVEAFKNVRGLDGWKEETFDIKGTKVRVAVTSGLSNTRKLMKALERGEVSYDFVEVMACPGGCAGGGGQPIKDGTELAGERGEELYAYDERSTIRFSHENQSIQNLYKNFLDKPCSHLAHDILHTDHEAWDMPVSPRLGLKDYEVCELCR